MILSVAEISTVEEDDDLFTAVGIDSLQVLDLGRQISSSFSENGGKQIATTLVTSLIYKNHTVTLLADVLRNLHQDSQSEETTSLDPSDLAEELVSRYVGTLPQVVPNGAATVVHKGLQRAFVILTGSTGSLGSYILDKLIKDSDIAEIWCLNRSTDGQARQISVNSNRGLTTALQSDRLHFRQAQLGKDKLNLSESDYSYLIKNATHIIDVQWQVDFNLTLASFEPLIKGVTNLAKLAYDGLAIGNKIKYFCTSAVGVANNASSSTWSIPEAPLANWKAAGRGYGESKLVAEKILIEASRRAHIPITICRVGQIAGPVGEKQTGQWTRKEWLPSIIDASSYLSLVPETLGRNEVVDWIPVNILASIILELATVSTPISTEHQVSERLRIVHAVNPVKTTWRDSVLPTVFRCLQARSAKASLRVVSLEEWVKALERIAAAASKEDEARVSALKLIPFLSTLTKSGLRHEFETIQSVKRSKALSELQAVNAQWVQNWLNQWGYCD